MCGKYVVKMCGKICGNIEKLSDWNETWCGSRYGPCDYDSGDKKRQKGKTAKRQKDKKTKRQKDKETKKTKNTKNTTKTTKLKTTKIRIIIGQNKINTQHLAAARTMGP